MKKSGVILWSVALSGPVYFIFCFVIIRYGNSPDPRVSMEQLGGLTADQVTARLGPARSDPRRPIPNHPEYQPWTPELEAERGPLQLDYDDSDLPRKVFSMHAGHDYSIFFENGRVTRIVSALK